MQRVVRAACPRILLAPGGFSGIAIGILALHSRVRAAVLAVAGASVAATLLDMRAVRGTAV